MRHTFCTNMANAGMDLKSLQYLMGHSDAGVTMNVYTHASYDHAEREMQKILQFQLPEEARKSGWHTNTFLHHFYTNAPKTCVNLYTIIKFEILEKFEKVSDNRK